MVPDYNLCAKISQIHKFLNQFKIPSFTTFVITSNNKYIYGYT